MKTYVWKHPDPTTLATVRQLADAAQPPEAPYELMALSDYQAWCKAELAAGWKPAARATAVEFVSKDTVVRRIRAAGKLAGMRSLLASMSADQQFEFTHLTTLDPTRADLRAGITQLGLDPDVILAP